MKTLLRRKILIGCKNGTNKKYEKCLTKCWIRFHSESCRLTVYAGLLESKRLNRHLWYKSIEKNKQCVIFCNICLNKRINGGNVVMRIQCAHNCTQSWSSNEPIKRQKQFFYLCRNKKVFFSLSFFSFVVFFSLTRIHLNHWLRLPIKRWTKEFLLSALSCDQTECKMLLNHSYH